jgi:hypothetical protein
MIDILHSVILGQGEKEVKPRTLRLKVLTLYRLSRLFDRKDPA